MSGTYFPFDLLSLQHCFTPHDPIAAMITEVAPLSMTPPWPWGHWLYGRLIKERCKQLTGDFIECGVGQGGMSLFLGRIAKELGRTVYALDSFSGLPTPSRDHDNPYFRPGDYKGDRRRGDLYARFLRAIADAKLSTTITPIRGWFKRSLAGLPASATFSFIHIDADLYGSVRHCLEMLYPRLVDGGILVIDDFFHHAQGPQRAVASYFASMKSPLLHIAFPYSIVLFKGESPPSGLRRALDGNHYSLRLLRQDPVFCEAVRRSHTTAVGARQEFAAEHARRFLHLLKDGNDVAAQIYEYWGALSDFWDDMDADTPTNRKAITI